MTFTIGSVSHGTMRPEDLVPLFVSTVEHLGGSVEGLVYNGHDEDDAYWTSEEVGWDLESLFDALNDLAPPYVYFDTHPGDGSDFGFWPDFDSLMDAIDDHGNVTGVPTRNDNEYLLEEDGIIVHVNDHGNVTVYDLERNLLWDCV